MSGFLLLGFLIGMRHALEADHIAAVAVLAMRAKKMRQILSLGIMWGLGHTLTLFASGAVIIVLDKNLPQNITLVLESLVVATLIFLGVDVILRLNKKRVHLNVYSRAKKNIMIVYTLTKMKTIMMFRLIAISPQKSCNFSSWLLE